MKTTPIICILFLLAVKNAESAVCPSGAKTESDSCCVFPFIAYEKKHFSCLTYSDYKWCSLTTNYDDDASWSKCTDAKPGCTDCSLNAECKQGKCECSSGYIGDGKVCKVQECSSGVQTESGSCCVFPFIAYGKKHYACRGASGNRWCSLTDNYTRDKKWSKCIECPTGAQTQGGNCCKFPFTYSGNEHRQCYIGSHYKWCSLTDNYNGKWSKCDTLGYYCSFENGDVSTNVPASKRYNMGSKTGQDCVKACVNKKKDNNYINAVMEDYLGVCHCFEDADPKSLYRMSGRYAPKTCFLKPTDAKNRGCLDCDLNAECIQGNCACSSGYVGDGKTCKDCKNKRDTRTCEWQLRMSPSRCNYEKAFAETDCCETCQGQASSSP